MRDGGNLVLDAPAARTAERETERVEGWKPVRLLIRAGFVARGITYGVIGALAFAIAVGAGTVGASPNQQGALALIARSVLGRVALIVISAGLIAYALWKLTQALLGTGPEGGGGPELFDRVANLGGGIVYIAFFAVAIRVLAGDSGNSSAEPRHAAAGILAWPGGQAIVAVCGVGLAGISLYQLYDAVCGHFAEDSKTQRMGSGERRLFMLLGRVGLTARALVFALVGYFLVRTAIEFNPSAAVGLDGALARVHHEPLGAWILGVVATGLLTFAAFSIVEAGYRRL